MVLRTSQIRIDFRRAKIVRIIEVIKYKQVIKAYFFLLRTYTRKTVATEHLCL